jgi:hypothetical protein
VASTIGGEEGMGLKEEEADAPPLPHFTLKKKAKESKRKQTQAPHLPDGFLVRFLFVELPRITSELLGASLLDLLEHLRELLAALYALSHLLVLRFLGGGQEGRSWVIGIGVEGGGEGIVGGGE